MLSLSPAEPYQSMTRGSAGQNKKITGYFNWAGLAAI
jgi:hypothetical protein